MRLINRRPAPPLAALPFVAVGLIYASASAARRAENPQDRLLPAPAQIVDTAGRLLFEPDRRTGEILFWIDTVDSLQRLGMGVGIAALSALVFGLAIGLLPFVRAGLASFVEVLSLIPPL